MDRVIPPHLMTLGEMYLYAKDIDDPILLEAMDRLFHMQKEIVELEYRLSELDKPLPEVTEEPNNNGRNDNTPESTGRTGSIAHSSGDIGNGSSPADGHSRRSQGVDPALRAVDGQRAGRDVLGDKPRHIVHTELDAPRPSYPVIDTIIQGLEASIDILDEIEFVCDRCAEEEIYLNPADHLPPVGCDLLILVGDSLLHVERTSYVTSRGDDMQYRITNTGELIEGRFPWTFP